MIDTIGLAISLGDPYGIAGLRGESHSYPYVDELAHLLNGGAPRLCGCYKFRRTNSVWWAMARMNGGVLLPKWGADLTMSSNYDGMCTVFPFDPVDDMGRAVQFTIDFIQLDDEFSEHVRGEDAERAWIARHKNMPFERRTDIKKFQK